MANRRGDYLMKTSIGFEIDLNSNQFITLYIVNDIFIKFSLIHRSLH